jgi:hypothetical protein
MKRRDKPGPLYDHRNPPSVTGAADPDDKFFTVLTDPLDLADVWAQNRRRRLETGEEDFESAFVAISLQVDRLAAKYGLNPHIAFLLKAAVATGDPRIALSIEALAQHRLVGRSTKPHLKANYQSRRLDGELALIVETTEQQASGGEYEGQTLEGEDWRPAAAWAAATLGVRSNSFTSAVDLVRKKVREARRRGMQSNLPAVEIGGNALPEALAAAVRYVAEVAEQARKDAGIKKSPKSPPKTSDRSGGK